MKPGKVMSQNPAFPQLPQPAYPSPIPELVHRLVASTTLAMPMGFFKAAYMYAAQQAVDVGPSCH